MAPLSIALLAAIFVGLPLILARVGATSPEFVRAWPECFILDEPKDERARLPRFAAGLPWSITLAIVSALKAFRSARAAEKERTLAAIERALVAHPELSEKVLTPITRSRVALPRERITAIIAAMIAMPTLPARVEDWLRLWRDSIGETDGLKAAVRAQIEADPNCAKTEQLRASMARVGLSLAL